MGIDSYRFTYSSFFLGFDFNLIHIFMYIYIYISIIFVSHDIQALDMAGLEQGGSQVDPGRALGVEQRQRRSGALRRDRHGGLRGGGDDLGESDPTAGPLHQGSSAWERLRLSMIIMI